MEIAGFVPTRAAALNKSAQNDFRIVSYETHKSKSKKKNVESEKETPADTRKGIDIKRARREIIKFGIEGFDTEKKREAKIALAVSLGAKPPKNPYKNYKDMLAEKRARKEEDDSHRSLQQAGKNAVGQSLAKKSFYDKKVIRAKKMNGGLLEAYGKASSSGTNRTNVRSKTNKFARQKKS